ncbi:MAG: malto-oligosyltrehalose trehalohydrolase [Polyangiales bacterium]
MEHGPRVENEVTTFRLWAPDRAQVELVLFDRARKETRRLPMQRSGGSHVLRVDGVTAGALYAFSPEGSGGEGEGPFPDPASRFQPFGVHGPSQLVGPLRFEHAFAGVPADRLVVYEVHVGTVTAEGTFRALIERLDHVRALGATAIELLPIADFPGDRNWGYDGVSWFAPARCYGTPEDLAALVDAAHARGLGVILDVVYNHFGPDGNYLRAWTKSYFTDSHKTPWGDAIDYSRDEVRALAIESAETWIREYRFDGLRLDATHALVPEQAPRLLTELAERVRRAAPNRIVAIHAEDERNEAELVRTMGIDAIWADDFHHEVRRIVAGDDESWFAEFSGELDELVAILRRGWLYEGQPKKNGEPRGTSAAGLSPKHFVYCVQNHDQVGNRAKGDRLHHTIPLGKYRAAVTLLLGAPYTPLLFMGQEIASSSPFAYFTDHGEELGRAVTAGRREEFAKFRAFADPEVRHHIPDPQAKETFLASKIDWTEASGSPGREVLALHRSLLALRAKLPESFAVGRTGSLLTIERGPWLYVIALREGGSLPAEGTIEIDTEGDALLDGSSKTLTLPGPGAVVLRRHP